MGRASSTSLPILSASEIKTYRACPRRHHIEYGLQYRAANSSSALSFGTATHQVLERIFLRTYEVGWVPFGLSPFDEAKLRAMTVGYHARWTHDTERYEVLGVEAEFSTPLMGPSGRAARIFRLGGKLDAIVRDRTDGRVWIVEHKTSAEDISGGSDYWLRLRMDAQISIYMHGARALGYQPSGVLYDVLRKPAKRPLKATPEESRKYVKATGALYASQRAEDETPDEYELRIVDELDYRRLEVVRTERDEEQAVADVWQTAHTIHAGDKLASWPRNPDACDRYNVRCPFWEVCTELTTLADNRYVRVPKRHMELTMEEG